MRYLKLMSLVVIVMGLSACAGKHEVDFTRHAQIVSPIVIPPGVNAPREISYYPVPRLPGSEKPHPVSLIPPGSKILQYQKEGSKSAKQQARASHRVEWAQLKNGIEVVKLPVPPSKAWAKVGRVLRQTQYQVLDKDRDMKAYYVLDTDSTGDKITTTTPIYRVNLKPAGNYTELELMDQYNKPADPKVVKRILTAVAKKFS